MAINTTLSQKLTEASIPIKATIGSALSLKSIQQKRAFESQKNKVDTSNPKALPKDAFTEKELVKHWNEFGRKREKMGERFLASTFAMHKPKLKDSFIIYVEVPNQGMKVDIEKIRVPLLEYFHQRLNNYSVDIEIKVEETITAEVAYTKEDKYKKLRDKNPMIDVLRAKFDLEL